jgi:hypothetical protein
LDVRRALAPLTLLICCAASASALATTADPRPPGYLPPTPGDYSVSAREAVRVAKDDPEVRERARRPGRLETAVAVSDDGAWRVAYSAGGEEVALVLVDGSSGTIRESWTGEQVAWPMARGYEGQFGHVLNAPYVWIPLCAVFLIGLVQWRRPLRLAHLDLLALLAFGASHVFFNRGEIGVSAPLVYPVLVYLMVRMLWIGLRGGDPLRPSIPVRWLAIAAIFLVVFRVTLNVADSGVIDVGYAGAVGADRITHGQPIYGEDAFPDDNRFGDTYGPANYYAYVPFELVLPWSGEWDELAASHAAAIAFDLATVAGLFVFARRLRPGRAGRELGIILAFAWLAYPYTAFALQSSSNDALIAALLAWSLALFARPVARGALLALAVGAKFAPLVLAPLYAAGERGLLERWAERRSGERFGGLGPPAVFVVAFVAVAALLLAHPAIDPGLVTFLERTVASQLDRSSPFSVWGQVEGIEWLRLAIGAAVAALALGLAFLPRRRTVAQIAALSAAVVIGVELTAEHWFYLYIPWFTPALLIALATAGRPRGAEAISPVPARAAG